MNIYLLILFRIIHIFAGVLWVGSAIFVLFFVGPAIKSFGPSGWQFMKHLVSRRRYPEYIGIVSVLTILSGAGLFWSSSGGLQLSWITSGPGIGFTIGSVLGIAVFVLAIILMNPIDIRMRELDHEIDMAGGTPNPAQAAELHALDKRLATLERVDFVLLTISLLTMATARFWVF